MATGYGNFVSGSKYGWRVQVVVNTASETATTITYNVYGQFYNEHRILSFANGSVSGGGQSRSWDGSTRDLNGGNPGTTNFASYSVTLNKGGSSRTETFSARFQVTGGFGNGTSSASVGVTVPAITYSAPNAPSNCSASRVSDTRATVTWSNGSTSTAQPRTDVLVERQTDSGPWVQVASLSASATNYTDNGISANHRYAYRVRSKGNGGTSGYSTSGYIYTTPAAPSSVTAAKASTSSVTLSAEGLPMWAEGYEIGRTADGGGSWKTVGAADTFPWTDASAPAGTIRYRVRSHRGSLHSAYVESNSITTITPPLAPTVQALPSVVATGSAVTVQWTPNHPDGSAQAQAQVEYTVGSGSPQTATVKGAGTGYRLPASATSSAGTVKVRVRTHGLDDRWGAWSAAQTVRAAVPPSASITVPPIDGARVGSLPLTVEWDASDATGVSSQSIALLDSSGSTLYSAGLGASERELELDESTYLLDNATDYSLRLTVRGGSSLTATVARSFSTSFAEPARPDAGLSVDPSDLSAAVTVYAGGPSSEAGEGIGVPAAPGTLVPGLTVYGSTRQNLWVNPIGTGAGVTTTNNGDGSMAADGVSTDHVYLYNRVYQLAPGSTYTLTIDKTLGFESVSGIYIDEKGSDGSTLATHSVGIVATELTFTANAALAFCLLGIHVSPGQTVSGTYRVMLNEGGEAQPWCPPGLNGVDELSIVTAGKNLLARMGPSLPYTTAGITFSDNGDGGIRVSGTATASASYSFFGISAAQAFRITPGSYTASLGGGGRGLNLSVEYFEGKIGADRTSWLATNAPGIPNTGSIDRPVYLSPFLRVERGTAIDAVAYPQLELGSTATAYEPPAVTATPVDLDGHAINSLPDGTRDELRVDGTGAVTLVQRVGVAEYTDTSTIANDTGYRVSTRCKNDGASDGDYGNSWCDKTPVGQPPAGKLSSLMGTNAHTGISVYCTTTVVEDKLKFVRGLAPMRVLYPLATPREVDLPGIAMPSFPAAETQAFCASNVPCGVRVDYPETKSFTVQRALPDGSRHTIATGLTEGQQALDRLPPLNVDYTYLVTAYAETGVSSTQELPAHVDSGGMEAFNFGQGASIALLMGCNASGSESADHGGTLYDFATGDGSLPLFYPTGALTGSASRSYAVTSREHANRVRALSREYPEAWFRDFDGNRMLCRASFSISLVQGSRDVRTVDVTMDECEFEEASNG